MYVCRTNVLYLSSLYWGNGNGRRVQATYFATHLDTRWYYKQILYAAATPRDHARDRKVDQYSLARSPLKPIKNSSMLSCSAQSCSTCAGVKTLAWKLLKKSLFCLSSASPK